MKKVIDISDFKDNKPLRDNLVAIVKDEQFAELKIILSSIEDPNGVGMVPWLTAEGNETHINEFEARLEKFR